MSILTKRANCVKYALFALNFVFLITGIILIVVGVGVANVFDNYEVFLVARFFSIPIFLIAIGAFIFFISLIGCWGAIQERYCLILIFSILLGLIFIYELAVGIGGYVLRNDAEDLINGTLYDSIQNYNKDGYEDTTDMWDYIQREFRCCGAMNYTDWSSVIPSPYLPISCCTIPHGTINPFSCTTNNGDMNRNPIGCLMKFSNLIRVNAVSLGVAGVVIAILQFFGVIFACYIAREVKIRNRNRDLTLNSIEPLKT